MTKFRISIDVEVDLEDFNKESVLEDLKVFSNFDEIVGGGYLDKEIKYQEDCFRSILEDKKTLSKLLIACAVSELNEMDHNKVHKMLNIQHFDEIIDEAALSLNGVDHDYFKERQKESFLSEHLEHVYNRFKSRTTNIEVEDLS